MVDSLYEAPAGCPRGRGDQPRGRERAQGLADGAPADAEPLGELRLGREAVADLEVAGEDRGADLQLNLFARAPNPLRLEELLRVGRHGCHLVQVTRSKRYYSGARLCNVRH